MMTERAFHLFDALFFVISRPYYNKSSFCAVTLSRNSPVMIDIGNRFKNNSDLEKEKLLKQIAYHKSRLSINPDNYNLLYQIALMYWQLADLQHADNPSRFRNQISLFADEALFFFSKADKHRPQELAFLFDFSSFLEYYVIFIDDLAAPHLLTWATKILRDADLISPKNVQVHYQIGRKHLKKFGFVSGKELTKNTLLKSIDEFKMALTINPFHLDSLNDMADAHLKLGWGSHHNCEENFRAAIDIADKAIKINQNPLSNSHIAEAYLELYQLSNNTIYLKRAKIHIDIANVFEENFAINQSDMYESLKANGYEYLKRMHDALAVVRAQHDRFN